MKTNKETVLASDALSPDGRMMAKILMEKDGVSIERLFNLLAEFKSNIEQLERYSQQMDSAIDQAQYDIDCHIRNHD
jgi:hypothetical protein